MVQRAYLKFVRLEFIGASFLSQTVHIKTDAGQSFLVCVEYNWRNQAVVSGYGDVNVNIVKPSFERRLRLVILFNTNGDFFC